MNEFLIILAFCVSLGIYQDKTKPKVIGLPTEQNDVVRLYELNKKYQCPSYCDVDHIHKVHPDSLSKEQLDMSFLIRNKKNNRKR